ncbi:sigma factor [Bradyrhizobium elkanii]
MSSSRLPERDPLAPYRARLTGLAYRMLGSRGDADDVVQDAWLRFAAARRRSQSRGVPRHRGDPALS